MIPLKLFSIACSAPSALLLVIPESLKHSLKLTGAVLLISLTGWSQDLNTVSRGIPDSVFHGCSPDIEKYEKSISTPRFIDWGKNGKTLLFDDDSLLLEVNKDNGSIVARVKADHLNGACFSPDYRKFIYQEDQDGDENYQLFHHDISSQTSFPLSQKGVKSYDPFWSSNGSKIAFKSNLRNRSEVDLYVMDIKDPAKTSKVFDQVTDDGLVLDWNIKTDRMLVVKVISENDKQLFIIDNKQGTAEQINADGKKTAYSDAQFIPGHNAAIIVSDKDSEFLQLHYYNFEDRTFRNITSELNWDIDELVIGNKGRKAAFTVNQNGNSLLCLLDIESLTYEMIEGIPDGVIRSLKMNPRGNELAFSLLGSSFERKMFIYDITGKRLTRWKYMDKAPTDSVAFIEARTFNCPGKDAETGETFPIPCFIYRPVKPAETGSPVLIHIHGGPEGQALPLFDSYHQYLANELGIAVIVPNVRGSNGYGKSYMKADDWMNRENAVEDIGAIIDWIEKQDDLDHTRISVYGGSYGGFMVLSSLTHYPERIKCGIDIVGISNWITYLENTSDYRRDLRRVEYGDERIPEVRKFLEEISPVRNAWKIESPLLIFQGLNDPRVNYKESEQIYHLLNDQNKVIWYLLAKDEGHGFRKPGNRRLQRQIEVAFLKEYLLK